MFRIILVFFCSIYISFNGINVFAQSTLDREKEVQLLISQKEYRKALPILHELFESAPYDKKFYDNYYKVLIDVKSYDTAFALSEYMTKIRKEDLSIYVDKGNALELKGDKKQATKEYTQALELLSGNEYQASGLAAAFRFIGKTDFEIQTYEAYQKQINNPHAFAYDLAILYDKAGATDKAVDMVLKSIAAQPFSFENAKQALERIIAGDPKKTKRAETAILKLVKEDAKNYLWRELFTWMQSEKGDRSGQLAEIIKLDELQEQRGALVFRWVREQYQKEELEHALQGLNYILGLNENILQADAGMMALTIKQLQLERTFPINANHVNQLLNEYQNYFAKYPQQKNGNAIIAYTKLLGLYANQPKAAIDTLEAVLVNNRVTPQIVGEAKLAMGDFQILLGNVWQAALLYSQVDKSFKEDYLGEEARFRNAKLSYYRGDFEYAQGQLSVLKASTSEFIANDALYLSVLITENTPEDKSFDALKLFAKADLLQFQHKYAEADRLLDSLSEAFLEDELLDDVFLQRAHIAMKKQDYEAAARFLKVIIDKYGDDVLADDALMQLATIYEQQFKDIAKARTSYEELVVKYPGSSFAQQARARIAALANSGT